jgi:hypothetical protein
MIKRIISAAALIGAGVALISTIIPNHQWDTFAAEHHCQLVSESEASLTPGISSSGRVYVSRHTGKQKYKCDDGVIRTRNQ